MNDNDDDCRECGPKLRCKCARQSAIIEFDDRCPVPFEVLLGLNAEACKNCKQYTIGWCQGQVAIGLDSCDLAAILADCNANDKAKDILFALINGDVGCVCPCPPCQPYVP